jgi:uncharacterized RDD family membrane protein YckC
VSSPTGPSPRRPAARDAGRDPSGRQKGTAPWGQEAGGDPSGQQGTAPWAGAPAAGGTAGPVDLDGLRLPAELVTGEAVVLELRPASFASRALSLLLDAFVYFGLLWVSFFVVITVASTLDDAGAAAVVLVTTILFVLVVPVAIETGTRGRSIGKYAAGLRVVRDDGGPIRFRQAFVRGLLAVVEVYGLPFVALISALVSARGKRLGDLLAGTYVIRERGGVTLPPPVVMPPHLAGWAAAADIGRIPERLALAARGYLGRVGSLHPQARGRLGVTLADQVATYVAPTPPPGTLPEAFLAAVLAERTRRELDRLLRAQQVRAARAARRHGAPLLSASSHRLLGED